MALRPTPTAAASPHRLHPRFHPASSCRRVSRALVVTGLLGTTLGALAVPADGAPDQDDVVIYTPPVSAEVNDPFRAPSHPYGPGNRGLDYVTDEGQEVSASADGDVLFTGQVGGDRHVTVEHADGIRTSYSFLAGIDVVVGQQVDRGQPLGTARAGRFHFGARRGDVYLDPATLFAGTVVEVELLPLEVPPGMTPAEAERMVLEESLSSGDGLSLPDLPLPSLTVDDVPSAAGVVHRLYGRRDLIVHYGETLAPARVVNDIAWDLARRQLFPTDCTGDGRPVTPVEEDRVAVTVGGLGSSSSSASIQRLDLDDLGYADADVVAYSYAGDGPYASEDTQGDLREAADHLVDLIEETAVARPGVPVDVFGHSMGGVVIRLALLELEDRGFPMERLGLVTTLGSPHDGANLATLVDAANRGALGRVGLAAGEEVLDTGIDPDSEAVRQLSSVSPEIDELAEEGIPDGIELLSVAARGDRVVPTPRTEVAGARNVVVPVTGSDAHSEMVGAEQTTREVALALADEPPRCVGVWDATRDAVEGEGIAAVQDTGGAALSLLP